MKKGKAPYQSKPRRTESINDPRWMLKQLRARQGLLLNALANQMIRMATHIARSQISDVSRLPDVEVLLGIGEARFANEVLGGIMRTFALVAARVPAPHAPETFPAPDVETKQ